MRLSIFFKQCLLAVMVAVFLAPNSGICGVVEPSLTYSLQEGTGLSLGVAFPVPPGPFLSRLGFEIGERSYRGREGQAKTLKAKEFGLFTGLDLYQKELFKLTLKVAMTTLDLPAESTKKSLSRFNFVLSVQSLSEFFYDWGIGLSWRHEDHSSVEVGRAKLEKTLLLFPSFGFGFRY